MKCTNKGFCLVNFLPLRHKVIDVLLRQCCSECHQRLHTTFGTEMTDKLTVNSSKYKLQLITD